MALLKRSAADRPRRGAIRARGALALAFSLTLAGALHGAAHADDVAQENWATKRARELTADGEAEQKAGRGDVAVQRFRQAIDVDPTFGQAYLDLGALRVSQGDLVEAERTYSAALEHIAGFTDGFLARASVRKRQGKRQGAVSDLESALDFAPTNTAIALQLVEAAVQAGNLPLALGVARRAWRVATDAGDTSSAKEARISIRALELLLGGVDPVGAANVENPVRRAIARHKDPPRAKDGATK